MLIKVTRASLSPTFHLFSISLALLQLHMYRSLLRFLVFSCNGFYFIKILFIFNNAYDIYWLFLIEGELVKLKCTHYLAK